MHVIYNKELKGYQIVWGNGIAASHKVFDNEDDAWHLIAKLSF